MSDLKYTNDHEWVRVEGDIAVVGISDFAQEQLGDVVFVELPEAGKALAKGDEAAVIESVKAASELYPGLVNEAPTGDGWFVKIRMKDASELDALMDEDSYQKFVQG
jgi:glycine cleavage system H protein